MPQENRIDPSTIDLSRLDEVVFRHGSHLRAEDGMSVMEAVAWVAGVGHTDTPPCVPMEISRLARRANDADIWDSDEQRTEALRPLISLMLRASHAPEARTKRAYLAAHFAAQKAADALDSAGLKGEATKLRVVPLPTSREECLALRSAAQEARRAADTAAAAAAAAYYASAAHFVGAAAASAAYFAGAAAYFAADDAVGAAADAAAEASYYADADAADAAAYYAAADAAQKLSSEARREVRRADLLGLLRKFCEMAP